jgi:hypothetical protein
MLLLLLHVRFFCVIFDGSRKREREIVDVDKHFLSFFFVTCVRIFASSCCSWDRQCLSVCIYQTRSCRFCLFLALFVSPRELIRRRRNTKKRQHFDFLGPTSWSIFFSYSSLFIYLFIWFQIENVSIFSPGLLWEKVEETNHSRVHECGASEGIELVLLVTHHQILFPNFVVVV